MDKKDVIVELEILLSSVENQATVTNQALDGLEALESLDVVTGLKKQSYISMTNQTLIDYQEFIIDRLTEIIKHLKDE